MPALLATLLALPLQDKKPDHAAELAALVGELEAAEETFWGALRAAKGEDERRRIMAGGRPELTYMPKFQDLAKRAEGTEAAAGALKQIFFLGYRTGRPEASLEAVDVLMAAHLKSPVLEEVAELLGTDPRHKESRTQLRRMLEQSPHAAVRAAAQFSLGCQLLRTGEPEGRRLLEDLRKTAPDSPYAKRAEGTIFELEFLQIGRTPPDFEAVDPDGKAFKLSDYRGKVVVLDFWGYW